MIVSIHSAHRSRRTACNRRDKRVGRKCRVSDPGHAQGPEVTVPSHIGVSNNKIPHVFNRRPSTCFPPRLPLSCTWLRVLTKTTTPVFPLHRTRPRTIGRPSRPYFSASVELKPLGLRTQSTLQPAYHLTDAETAALRDALTRLLPPTASSSFDLK